MSDGFRGITGIKKWSLQAPKKAQMRVIWSLASAIVFSNLHVKEFLTTALLCKKRIQLLIKMTAVWMRRLVMIFKNKHILWLYASLHFDLGGVLFGDKS